MLSVLHSIVRKVVMLTIAGCLLSPPLRAQLFGFLDTEEDTAYVEDLSDKLMVRALATQKFNKYTLGQYGYNENLTYRATKNYNAGIGFSYDWIGANLTFQIPNANRGQRTRFFDLQSFFYFTKAVVDLYALSYKGYNIDDYYQMRPQSFREDLKVQNYGMNVQYILNAKRFSYRAAFVNNQIQRKSAGSVLIGGGLHYTNVTADSAVIPPGFHKDVFFGGHPFNQSNSISLSVNAGYGYTFVFWEQFFATASLVAGPGINYVSLNTEATGDKDRHVHGQWQGVLRGATGWNGERYAVTLQYTNYIGRNNMPVTDGWQQLQTGGARIMVARRFTLKKKTVDAIDELEEQLIPELN